MLYAKIQDNIISEILSTAQKPAGYKDFPEDAEIYVGADMRFFTNTGRMQSLEECISQGLVDAPGDNQVAVWDMTGWTIRNDYSNNDYWLKETAEPVSIPANTVPDNTVTTQKPLDVPCTWDKKNDRWAATPDYRGSNYWDASTGEKVIFTLGQEPDDSMTNIPPPDPEALWENGAWVIPLNVWRERYLQEVRGTREQQLAAGVLYEKAHIQCDANSQQAALRALLYAQSEKTYTQVSWRTHENTFIVLDTLSKLEAMVVAMNAYVNKAYKASWTAKDALTAATSKNKLDNAMKVYRHEKVSD